MKKKILYLITQSEFGGAQKYVFNLAKNLCANYNVEVGVGMPGNEHWLKDLEKQKIKIFRMQYTVRQINPLRNILSIFEIYKIIKKTKPDIVHLNSSMIGFVGAVTAWIYKIKCQMLNVKCQMSVIYTVHGLILNEKLPFYLKTIYWVFEFLGRALTHKIICVSHFDKKSVLKYKLSSEKKITVIHNGIDIQKYEFLSKEKSREKLLFNVPVPRDNIMIGFIGYFYPSKGLSYLISAAEIVCQKKSNLNFILIGKGQEKEKLKQIIKKNGLEKKIIFTGELLNASQYLKVFDVFVLPSLKEGLSYTLIEALAAGIPIVCTKVGGSPEIVENEINGFVVPPADPDALADAILKILDNQNLANKFASNNLEKVKKFGLEKMISKTEKIYDLRFMI